MTMKSSIPKAFMNVLVAPSKVAKNMNSGAASVLSLNIHRDRIGVAVASHKTVEKLTSIPMEWLKKGNEGTEQLNRIVDEHNVCGFVVAWPVQKDTGQWGAPCGRVLHTLDKIMVQSDNTIFTPERPFCFWDSFRSENTRRNVDAMGRCSSYGEASGKTRHVASEEQYNQDENVTATKIWDDFCKIHLPQVAKRTARAKKEKDKRGPESHNLVSDWDSQRPYSKALA